MKLRPKGVVPELVPERRRQLTVGVGRLRRTETAFQSAGDRSGERGGEEISAIHKPPYNTPGEAILPGPIPPCMVNRKRGCPEPPLELFAITVNLLAKVMLAFS